MNELLGYVPLARERDVNKSKKRYFIKHIYLSATAEKKPIESPIIHTG